MFLETYYSFIDNNTKTNISASEGEAKMAVKAKPRSNPSVSPVLKMTGRPEGGVAPPIRNIDQFALKVANGGVMKEKRFIFVTEAQTSEPPASPPVTLRASEVPLPEGEGLGGKRWFARTDPQVLVIEAGARTTLERLLERRRPSEAIPRLRTRNISFGIIINKTEICF